MKVMHEGRLIATIGDNLSLSQIEGYLVENSVELPVDQLDFIYEREEALQYRKLSYVQESDPLYMEWQYDQTPESKQVWMDRVAEIKARYPLPTA
ncbi:hypothetical protein [Pseudoalteromonas piscicida]|uniref:hypothetical protein n=1 Tax=Pseudoalteromonas piscicida TaxID=43662 RepID=UPI0005FA38F7|nr:hypothetical protein TW73_07630 [Pseudoalteromonas piscicida]